MLYVVEKYFKTTMVPPNDKISASSIFSASSSSFASNDEEHELEYELETCVVANKVRLEILAVVPPPLEFLSQLHTDRNEISGRQVWCGSMLLAHVFCHWQETEEDFALFSGKR